MVASRMPVQVQVKSSHGYVDPHMIINAAMDKETIS